MEYISSNISPETNQFNFKYFIDFALNGKITWEVLEVFLDDHSKTLPKSRELNKILLQKLQEFQTGSNQIQVKKDVNEFSQVWINNPETFASKSDGIDSKKRNLRHVLQNPLETFHYDVNEDEAYDKEVDFDFPSQLLDSNIDIVEPENDTKVQINPIIRCHFCEKKFDNPLNYKKHVEKIHENSIKEKKMVIKEESVRKTKFQCKICKMIFKTQKGLKNHICIHAETSNVDKIVFSNQLVATRMKYDNLQEKVDQYQTDGKLFQCKMCSEACETSELRQHVKVYHKPLKLNFECMLCGKAFKEDNDGPRKKSSHFKYHEEMHNRQIQSKGSRKCEICPKTFGEQSSITDLTKHMKTHDKTRKKKFECVSCSKGFFTSGGVKRHLEKNTCKTMN